MANPLFDKLGGAQQFNVSQNMPPNNYASLIARANQLAQSLPSNFNPYAIIQGMLENKQVSQEQLNQAMQLANQLIGKR